MIALAYILSLVHAGPIDKSVGFAARWATKEKMLPNLRRWLHYYFLVRGFNFTCLIKFGAAWRAAAAPAPGRAAGGARAAAAPSAAAPAGSGRAPAASAGSTQ